MSFVLDLPFELISQIIIYLGPLDIYNLYLGTSSNDIIQLIFDEISYNHVLRDNHDKLIILNKIIEEANRSEAVSTLGFIILNKLDLTFNELFIEGVRYGSLNVIKYAIENGAEINLIDYDEKITSQNRIKMSLRYIVKKGYWDLFNYFVDMGSDDVDSINIGKAHLDDLEYLKPIMDELIKNDELDDIMDIYTTAAAVGSINIIKYLIEVGYIVDNPENYGPYENVVEVAARHNQIAILELLHNILSSDPEKRYWRKVARGALSGGHFDLYKQALQNGGFYEVILATASRYGYVDIMKDIIKDHAISDETMRISFSSAIIKATFNSIKYLIELGYVPTQEQWNSMLKYAVQYNNIELFNMAVNAGITDYRRAFIFAIKDNNIEMIDVLKKYVNTRADFASFLPFIIKHDNVDLIQYYISQGLTNVISLLNDLTRMRLAPKEKIAALLS
jgi:hypothetical protein